MRLLHPTSQTSADYLMLTSSILTLFAKSVVVLGLAGIAALLLRRRSAGLRHVVWSVGVAGILILPIASLVVPGYSLPEAANELIPWHDASSANAPKGRPSDIALPLEGEEGGGSFSGAATETASEDARGTTDRLAPWFAGIWATGLALLLFHMSVGTVCLRRIERGSRTVNDAAWHRMIDTLCGTLEITRRPLFLMSDQVTAPMTWGVFRPVILFPVGAESWPEHRRRIVLAHELAHIRRHDVLFRILSRMACAFYWINPLVWITAHRLRDESEFACDDLVLSMGTRRVTYAEVLLEVARSAGVSKQAAFPAIQMARRSELEGRIRAVLDPDRKRTPLGRKTARVVWGAALCVVLALAAFRPAPAPLAGRSAPNEIESAAARGGICEQDRWASIVDEDSSATRRFLALLQSEHKRDRLEAVRGLGNVGTRDAVPAVIAALDDPSEHVRQGAAAALGNLGDPRAVNPLIASLDDPDEHVQQAAAGGLGDLGDVQALRPLSQELHNPNKHVRQTAALALGRLGDPAAADALKDALGDPEPHVRAAAVQALGQIGAREALEQIARVYETSENLHVRLAAARTLGQLGDRRGVGFLIETLRDEPEQFTRGEAAWALGVVNPVPEAEVTLVAALGDESRFVRYAAVCSLGRVGGDTAEDPLRRALQDASTSKRLHEGIIWALQQIEAR